MRLGLWGEGLCGHVWCVVWACGGMYGVGVGGHAWGEGSGKLASAQYWAAEPYAFVRHVCVGRSLRGHRPILTRMLGSEGL